MRVRNALKTTDIGNKLMGVLEIDETYVGGKSKGQNEKGRPGRNSKKTPVMGMIERDGRVVVKHVADITANTIKRFVDEWAGADIEVIYSDEYKSYNILRPKYKHKQINHSVSYVEGDVHTNGIENFWSLLKRGMVGTFHKVSVRHLHRYLDEFAFRFNGRAIENLMQTVLEHSFKRHESYRDMVAN
jgi:transposase-like protein